MPKNTSGYSSSQSSAIYVNKKGINELFEAIMTALMIHKPDDHISFIRKCLDKVEFNPNHIRWDHFITNSSSIHQKRPKTLPPIAHTKPLIFILSSSGSLTLCSRLLDRYQINYLSINHIANIDEDESIGKQYEHRYESVRDAIEQRRTHGDGFLIAGELDEQKFLHQWERKLGRIDLIFILSFDLHKIIRDQSFRIIQIDLNKDFADILATAIYYFDEYFPQDASISQRSSMASIETDQFNLPVIFCIDNHHRSIKTNDEFELDHEKEEENNNNSFIYSLCQRLAEEFSFKHIHYGELNKTFWNFEELKNEINESMNKCSGYIIDHFPTSFYDLKRFQSEIGHCSVLIYIGEHQTVTKANEINGIIEKFKQSKNVIYVDCRMEVDEIYDDLKSAILQHL